MKYRGGKPRGFAVLTARPKPGRAVAGECHSPRPSHGGSARSDTRTLGASVGVGGATPPDNSRRTTPKTWMVRGVAFLATAGSCFGVRSFTHVATVPVTCERWLVSVRPSPSEASGSRRLRRLLITELFDFRTTPRHSACPARRLIKYVPQSVGARCRPGAASPNDGRSGVPAEPVENSGRDGRRASRRAPAAGVGRPARLTPAAGVRGPRGTP